MLRLRYQGWSVAAAAASVTAERSPARLGLRAGDDDVDRSMGSDEAAEGRRDPATQRLQDAPTLAVRTFDGSAATFPASL